MPPIRTATITKPVKTERTHEENQERAYIAASRRSDRSLEARVESARRASEIHKRRTGRSLRVTEQDVVNEEMYEEEDDDLPLHYRRLTAHLGATGSPDFNRRLAAYLTQNVAMRSALGQAINHSYAQQYNNGQQSFIDPNQMNVHQPHFVPQHFSNTAPTFPTNSTMPPPQFLNRSPSSYRQSPYPMAPTPQHRASTTAVPTTTTSNPSASPVEHNLDERRMSAPVQLNTEQQHTSPSLSSPNNPTNSTAANIPVPAVRSPPQISSRQPHPTFTPDHMAFQHGFPIGGPFQMPYGYGNMNMAQTNVPSPLSTALPGDTQTFFNPGFDATVSWTANSTQADKTSQPFYSYNPNNFQKPRNAHPSFDGMSQTLAPHALDASSDHFNLTSPLSIASDGTATPFTPFNPALDPNFPLDMYKSTMMQSCDSTTGSGTMTPAVDGDWTSFIDNSKWEETVA